MLSIFVDLHSTSSFTFDTVSSSVGVSGRYFIILHRLSVSVPIQQQERVAFLPYYNKEILQVNRAKILLIIKDSSLINGTVLQNR